MTRHETWLPRFPLMRRYDRDRDSTARFARGAVVFLLLGAALIVGLPGSLADEVQSGAPQHPGHVAGISHFPVSGSEQAQVAFDRAVTLLHHMTYPQAREAFERVAVIDPQCAMAHWGIAMTLFQPLWPTRPRPEALQRGWDEVQKARALQPPTERERLFVAAAEAFFLDPASADYWLRIRRWEQAMEKLYAAFPDDDDASAFYALALLASAPANSPTDARARGDRAAEILLRVYERNPNHPGAMHYLVHANDTPGRERKSLDVTLKYESIAPENPHALHMPTHIYTRLGDWDGVIRGNLRAAQAALQYPAGERGEFVWDEFPHAIEYLVYAYLQKGMDDAAAIQLKRLQTTAQLEPSFKTAFHLASTQARYALERRAWQDAAQIVAREPATLDWDRYAWPEAIARFARGLGAAHVGRLDDAQDAADRLEELEASARDAREDLFARNIRMLRLELNGWIAHVQGREDSGLALLREAAELEASTPKHAVTPGPTYPAPEMLGDLLAEQKQPAEALAAYQRSIALYPRHFNSLLGAARTANVLDDESLARRYYQELLDVAGGGTRQPALAEAAAYVVRRH